MTTTQDETVEPNEVCNVKVRRKLSLTLRKSTGPHRHSLDSPHTHRGAFSKANRLSFSSNNVSDLELSSESGTSSPGRNIVVRRKSSMKRLKRSVSRRMSREKSRIGFRSKEREDNAINMDPRITTDIALFYIRQHLPESFPDCILELLFAKSKRIDELQYILSHRGWKMKLSKEEREVTAPSYYFGAWSYDCYTLFEGCAPGSFITCHQKGAYYVMFKSPQGYIQFEAMPQGPAIPSHFLARYSLDHSIERPPKRYNCKTCGTNSPCALFEQAEDHISELSDFVLTYPPAS